MGRNSSFPVKNVLYLREQEIENTLDVLYFRASDIENILRRIPGRNSCFPVKNVLYLREREIENTLDVLYFRAGDIENILRRIPERNSSYRLNYLVRQPHKRLRHLTYVCRSLCHITRELSCIDVTPVYVTPPVPHPEVPGTGPYPEPCYRC